MIYHNAVLFELYGALMAGTALMGFYYHMEIPEYKLDTLFYLREKYYHLAGKHPGYEKSGCAKQRRR